MALTKEEKATQLEEIKDRLQRSQSVIFSHYIGLSVADVSELRGQLKGANAEMKVAKKTLMRLATQDLQLPELEDAYLDGAVACIFSYDDPMTGAQVTFKFAKSHPMVEIIGGMFDGKLLTKEQAIAFAKMPTRQQLLGIFAGMLQSPLRSFASICQSPLVGFARGIGELAKKGGVPQTA